MIDQMETNFYEILRVANLKKKYMFTENILVEAHKHSFNNQKEILESDLCGCFHCLSIYSPDKIDGWLNENDVDNDIGFTALCSCGVDALIGSASNFPITSEFMQDMHARWFRIEL